MFLCAFSGVCVSLTDKDIVTIAGLLGEFQALAAPILQLWFRQNSKEQDSCWDTTLNSSGSRQSDKEIRGQLDGEAASLDYSVPRDEVRQKLFPAE